MIKNQKRTTSAENDYVLTNVTYTTPTVSTTPTNKTNKDLILTIQKRNFWKEESQTDKPTATIKIPLSDYVLRTYLEENYYNKVAIDGFIEQYKIKVVVLESKNNLPKSGDSRYADTSYLFLVRHTHTIDSSSQGDYFDEYIWNNDKSDYERIGNTDIDLSPYLKIADFNAWKNNTYTPTITTIQNDITSLQIDKENISNKVTSISDSSTDTQYPSAKLLNTELKKKEDTSNKVTSVNDSSTDTQYPSAKLLNTELKKKENTSNKVTSINDSSTDTQYPSAKLLNTELKAKEDVSNKTAIISANSTDNEYPTAKAVHSIASTKLDKSDAFSKNYNDLTNKPTIPTKTSDLINDSNFITGESIDDGTTGTTPSSHTHGNITNEGAIGTTANKPLITGTNGVIQAGSFGTDPNTFCEGNDPRLSDARTPTSHTHTKAEISDFPTSMTPTSHTHGNITNAGAIGSTANLPVITTTSGKLTTGSFGTGANTFCQGNDSRLSDARTPKSHTHTKAEISDFPTSMTPTSHTHMLDDISITSALGANSDLNDLTNVGIYTCGATNSGTLANRPPFYGTYAMLIENKHYNDTTIVQFVYVLMGASPLSFYRYLSSNGTWSSWTHMGGCSYTLPANSDLNDLKEFTIYACNTTNSKTLANKPFTGQMPCIIKNMPYNNVNYFIQFVYPLIDDNDLNDIYYRLYWNGAWLDWKKIITDVDMDAKADVNHNHVLDDINVTSALTANDDLNNYKEAGIYTCSKTNSGTLANKPYSINASCIIENKKFGSGSIVQFVYKVTTNANTCYDTYFRCYTGNTWTDWIRIYTDKDFVVSNSLTDTSAKNALSAKQGKVLNDRLDAMQTVETGDITEFNTIYNASGSVNYIKYNGWVVINYYNLKITSIPSGAPRLLFSSPYKALDTATNQCFYITKNSQSIVPTNNIQANIAYSGVLMYPTSD